MEGCKRRCIYCNQNSLKGHKKEDIDITDFVLSEREKYKNKSNLELAFYGGTFFNLPQERLEYLKEKILNLKGNGLIKSVRVSTTPDSINEKVISIFAGVIDRVELGIQSLDDLVLKILRRGYTQKDVLVAVNLLRRLGFEIGFQIMIGLPFESRESYINTINGVVRIKPDFTRLYPLFVIKRTPLSLYYRLGFFKPLTMEELIWRGVYSIARLEKAGIKIIRIGLNEFVDEKDLDFIHRHNDLKGLMMSELYKLAITKYLDKKGVKKDINILCDSNDFQYIIGINKKNINYLKERGISIKIKSENIEKNYIFINDEKLNVYDWALKN